MSASEPGATADQPGTDANQPGAAANKGPPYVLRLFITGTTSRSARAIANLRRVCEQRLHGEYDLEVIDIYQHPAAAKEYQMVGPPPRGNSVPLPLRRIIGDLANEER